MSSQNIPEIRIDTWEELKEFIGFLDTIRFQKQPFDEIETQANKNNFIFRGQRDPEWKLSSTLEREFLDNGLNLNKDFYNDICQDLLKQYKPLFRGRIAEQYLLTDNSFNDELWAFGQHYDLKTPLLDWSYSFFVALYFAFIKKDEKIKHRAVFILNRQTLPFQHNIEYIEPKFDIGHRLNAQKGLFTKNTNDDFEKINQKYKDALKNLSHQINQYQHMLKDFDFQKYSFFGDSPKEENNRFSEIKNLPLNKILISNTLRSQILNLLQSVNIDSFTLFPDTKGLIEQCHLELENMIFRLKMQGN